jgi:hypothetical protein
VYLAMADDASKRRDEVETDRYGPYEKLIETVENLNVEKAHEMRPLLNGNEVIQLLGVKPGPAIGQVMSGLMEWQMEYPGATKDDATRWIMQNYTHLRTAFPLTLRLRKTAAVKLTYDKGYVYHPVDIPEYDLPEGLKNKKEHHITVISPEEAPYLLRLSRKDPEDLFGELYVEGEPELVGIGRQSEDDNEVYYVVVNWPEIQDVRHAFGLPPKDLHITLGYTEEDIHGVPKDESTLIRE